MDGTVLWANSADGRFVLQDASGAAELQMNLSGRVLQPGQRIRLDGDTTITTRAAGFQLGITGPVVDDDGVHTNTEKSGSTYLHTGRHPLRLDWFNGPDKYGLQVEYQGPGLARQKIPDAALCGEQSTQNFTPGLNYACYPVAGEVLPDFSQLPALKTGTVSNFDLSVMVQPEHIGLEFTGFLQVPQDGLYTFYLTSDDGSRLFIDEAPPAIAVIGTKNLPEPTFMDIGQVLNGRAALLASSATTYQRVEVQGRVTFASQHGNTWELELASETGRLRLEFGDGSGLSPNTLLNNWVEVVGISQSAYDAEGENLGGVLLVSDAHAIQILKSSEPAISDAENGSGVLPVLTTASQVHQLSREEAQRGYPVKIRGVVTCVLPERQAFTVQDATHGIYVVDSSESRSVVPNIGEYLEIEGKTDPSLFAPIIDADHVNDLGTGCMPQPVQPTWDRLMNGSLDAQFVELQGVITTIDTNGLTLFTGDGRLRVELKVPGMKPDDLEHYEDAVIRIRGCLFASWDYVTHMVKVGDVRLYGADISVDQPAPPDMFSLPLKTVSDLLEFNPRASAFERVKVSGIVIYAQPPEYYLMDGDSGLQFVLKGPSAELQEGDQVEVVGFPGLSGLSPLLQEAVARKTGTAQLPTPKKLAGENLIHGDYDSTRVSVEGLLINVQEAPAGEALEMSTASHTFTALLNIRNAFAATLAPGSRLELTGVYAGEGGNRALGQNITSFELLLASPADIKILDSPPWWTLKRLLVITGGLVCVLLAAFLWITLLHKQVDQRTAELAVQIRQRENVEHQRAMEQERTRIARDLHDELGSGITEISMLVSRAKLGSAPEDKRGQYLNIVREKARELVTVLDEIVWAMNPRHDSLASLVSYFNIYADRFLGLANIAWRLENASGTANPMVQSQCRHELFLVFKEALTNVVRHAGASEVLLYIQTHNGELLLNVTDNGRGFSMTTPSEAMDGVANMRTRIEKLGGRFEITGDPNRGTTVRLCVPLTGQ